MVIDRFLIRSATLWVALAVAGCGGDSSTPLTPTKALTFELLSGAATTDLDHCQSVDGTTASARFSRLLRATVYSDAIYLAETGEGCTNAGYDPAYYGPVNIEPTIRKLSVGSVETIAHLSSSFTVTGDPLPILVRYPSGFVRNAGSQTGGVVLAYVAANSDQGFALDSAELERYNTPSESMTNGWDYYVPGLFRLTSNSATQEDLAAGAPGLPPALADGQGRSARFVAPHDLEISAAGVFHVIDDGHIRTIDAGNQVRTLDHTALGITGAVKALDADHQGRVHVLAQRGIGRYTMHRLSDGFRLDFQTPDASATAQPATLETFTVIGNEILLSVRQAGSANNASRLYRVSSTGEVRTLTGNAIPATPEDFLTRPSQYLLPPVQHVEYGVDGHLYIVLPQGLLVARDYE